MQNSTNHSKFTLISICGDNEKSIKQKNYNLYKVRIIYKNKINDKDYSLKRLEKWLIKRQRFIHIKNKLTKTFMILNKRFMMKRSM